MTRLLHSGIPISIQAAASLHPTRSVKQAAREHALRQLTLMLLPLGERDAPYQHRICRGTAQVTFLGITSGASRLELVPHAEAHAAEVTLLGIT